MSIYSQTILQDSPLAYWRLGERSGTTAADASGNGRNGTYHSCTLGLAGAIAADNNAAAAFDGSTSYVDGVSLSVGGNFTLEAWAYKTVATSGAGAAIMGQNNAAANDATFFWAIDGGAGAGFTTATGVYRFITLADVSLNTWHHHALTYDGSTLRYYLDAVLTTSGAATGTPESLTNHCTLGRLGDFTGGQFWPGLLDEAAVYASALSAARIAAHYQAGVVSGILAPPVFARQS